MRNAWANILLLYGVILVLVLAVFVATSGLRDRGAPTRTCSPFQSGHRCVWTVTVSINGGRVEGTPPY